MILDEVDIKIISVLRENARTPYTEMAKELKLSESAIRKRINRLAKSGVIRRFTIDYSISNEIRAIILVKTQPPTPVPEVSKNLIKVTCTDRLYEITGEYDIVVIGVTTDIPNLNKCIDEIRNTKGVASTNSMVVLRSWP
ncbi:MAG: HTH-type transcriptional regulator LysM [Sulfolobales archaeon]|nr:HTH-type transcriptional regulator LysM [Sulfolobales archaeon]MDW7969963.1 HTH-type transcriptional regulator LysM [Sulfolobales archaeon]